MVRDEGAALDRLFQEAAQTPRAQGMLFEPIGGGFCRAHLAAWPCQVPLEILNRAFCHAASARADGDLDGRLALLRSAAEQGRMPFSAQALAAYLDAYRAGGCPAVHHSTAFGGAYHPAYRVVSPNAGALFPVDRGDLRTAGAVRPLQRGHRRPMRGRQNDPGRLSAGAF
jgi:hypothetical protein